MLSVVGTFSETSLKHLNNYLAFNKPKLIWGALKKNKAFFSKNYNQKYSIPNHLKTSRLESILSKQKLFISDLKGAP